MTKAELVAKIAKETGANPKEVLPVIECLMNTIKETLSDGENVYLRGFGNSGGGNTLSSTQYAMGYFVMAKYVNNEFGIYLY